MTGEHGAYYELINHSGRACTLAGYPQVTLSVGGDALPFRYVFGRGPYVTGKAPATVTVNPGGAAWVLVAKYRCDLGDLRDATAVSLTLPGTARPLTGPVSPPALLSYCKGGASDPGQVVAVSPVEPAATMTGSL